MAAYITDTPSRNKAWIHELQVLDFGFKAFLKQMAVRLRSRKKS